MKKFLAIALILFLILSCSAVSFAGTFQLDPSYSTISFRIKHLMGFAVGYFSKFDGTIVLNEDNRALVSLNGTIDIASLDTRLPQRDEDLRSEKFFDAGKFPEGKFVSTSISKDKITADLTIKGITKPVVFDYTFLGMAKDQHGNTKTALSLTGKISRKDFGVDYNMQIEEGKWLLGDEVEFRVELHGILKE